jgi:magnesium transporter
VIVDSAIYVDGRRSAPYPLEKIHEARGEKGGFAWIGLYEPTKEEFDSVADEFGLHELAANEAIKPRQRPRIERYEDTLFVVLKTARYLEEKETVEFGEIHALVGPDFIVTVAYGETSELGEVRRQMEGAPDLLRRGPFAVLYTIMARVVDDYGPVAEGLENDIDEIEEQVFEGDPGTSPEVSRRIYELSRKVIQFHQATQPLARTLGLLTQDGTRNLDPELRRYLRDVHDRVLRVTERVESFRELLTNILSVNLTLIGINQTQISINQNDQVKKISAWAAILVVPTLITGIYGMNFEYMPELHWLLGYPFSLLLMLTISVILYRAFKRSGWL